MQAVERPVFSIDVYFVVYFCGFARRQVQFMKAPVWLCTGFPTLALVSEAQAVRHSWSPVQGLS